MMLDIRIVEFNQQQALIKDIRHRVFSLEQGVDPAIDFDGLDKGAIQVLALKDGKAMGTGRMLPDGHIGRIAVLREFRSEGVGSAIMRALMEIAAKECFSRVYLHAQVKAVPFYSKLGFSAYGDDFMEAGILHTPMQLVMKQESTV